MSVEDLFLVLWSRLIACLLSIQASSLSYLCSFSFPFPPPPTLQLGTLEAASPVVAISVQTRSDSSLGHLIETRHREL